jgi:hypothetical protein
MATPVVAGLAALIMECYPRLSAAQVADIIRRSVVKVQHPVIVPGRNPGKSKKAFGDLCAAGGIVNAYDALLLASRYKSPL